MATKLFGIVRNSFLAKYLGASMVADAFNAAIRIPGMLQNLFGDGAMSAAFIPVYSRLLAEGNEEEAGRVAGAVFAILTLLVAVLVTLGVLFTPQLLPILAGGFKGEKRELTITFVRILFPASGAFVLAAWALGVLNSHRKFLLSYSAGIAWNLAIIAALWWYGGKEPLPELARITAWASLVGAALQFLVQLPHVIRLVPRLRIRFDTKRERVRQIMRNFAPVFVSRGVVQLSNFIDIAIASFMPNGLVSLLSYATTISYVPVSMFGMAISAAELPELSSVMGAEEERNRQLRERVNAGLRQVAFFVVPSAMAMVVAGDLMVAALFQRGEFTSQDSRYAWSILAGSAFGLLAGTMGRLYSSTYYALHDTRTPLNFAVVRVILTSILGYAFAIKLPLWLHFDPHWGGAGLTVSFGIAGWVEFALLRRSMNRRIGVTGAPAALMTKLWTSAVVAGAATYGLKLALSSTRHIVAVVLDLGLFAIVYGVVCLGLRVPEAHALVRRLKR